MPSFTFLPAEIKCQIWDEVIPRGRILSIFAPLSDDQRARLSSTSLDLHLVNRLPPPALSQVDRASRSYVLHYYGIKPEHAGIPWTAGMVNFKWFHPDNDILAFHNYGAGQDLKSLCIPWRETETPDMLHHASSTGSTAPDAYGPIGGKDAGVWFVSKQVRSAGILVGISDVDTVLVPFDVSTLFESNTIMHPLSTSFPKVHTVLCAEVHSMENSVRLVGVHPFACAPDTAPNANILSIYILDAYKGTCLDMNNNFAALTSTCRPSSRNLIESVARQFIRYKGGMPRNSYRGDVTRLLLGYTPSPQATTQDALS